MSILEQVKADYERFPQNPTYSLYSEEVYFQDPVTQFRGIQRYQQMIQFMTRWFQEMRLELHSIQQDQRQIKATWTLFWTSPLPWRPAIQISGRSELELNDQDLIISHRDFWDCSPWEVFQQHFSFFPSARR
ncbi:MAG: DUF2358 domain-containing protein [Merismopediaceae bacterium]|nr:DUF2358 domain-containing protein [Merismopediaceae bacterium]